MSQHYSFIVSDHAWRGHGQLPNGIAEICFHEVPGWSSARVMSCSLLLLPDCPLYKNVEKKLRPPGVHNPLVRTWHRQVIKFNKLDIVNVENPPWICCSSDWFKTLLQCIQQGCLIKQLEDEPTLHHLAWNAASTLAPKIGHIGLEAGGSQTMDSHMETLPLEHGSAWPSTSCFQSWMLP